MVQWVLKIGGSLFPNYAIDLLKHLKGMDIIVISGGGLFANTIREYDEYIHFSDTANHKSAIAAMDIIAILLADKVEFAETVCTFDEAKNLLKESKIPILLSSKIMNDLDPLEHSWRITSDSIAFYISKLLDAELIIATDVDGLYFEKSNNLYIRNSYNNNVDFINSNYEEKLFNKKNIADLEFIKEIHAKKLLSFNETCVDSKLPELLIDYESNCYIVNGKFPDRVLSLIKNQNNNNFLYTIIRGD